MSESHVQELLERWKELRDRGTPLSSEELCRDCPELIPQLRQLLDEQAPTSLPDATEKPPSPVSENSGLQLGLIVEDVAARADREEAETLRGRLRLAAIVFLVHWLIFAGEYLFLGYPLEAPFAVALEVVVLAAMLIALSRSRSLRALRWFEWLTFGAVTQMIVLSQSRFFLHDFTDVLNVQDGLLLRVGAASLAAPWFEVIVVYGFLIPNSWQRCAAVVTSLTVLPLALIAGFAFHFGVLNHAAVLSTLTTTGVRLAFADTIAILGCRRIHKLVREAHAARELGQYTLKQRLGQGGMADVYLAEHRLLRRLCAIKLIRTENADNPHAQRRFAREVRAMARIRHPNVVEIFDYGVSFEGKFYYVMEYLSGVNLDELVRRHGPLPADRAIYLLRQVAAALEAMHVHGVIHRDVKPSNVFVSAPDVVKLFDFGLVHLDNSDGPLASIDQGRLTRDNRLVGTPAYMAPEQIDLSRPTDVRTDLYALGLVGYFLIAGRNPFVRDDLRQIFAAQVQETPPPLQQLVPGVPPDLHDVVHRCLAKNPDERYPRAPDVQQALDACACAHGWDPARAAAWWQDVAGVV